MSLLAVDPAGLAGAGLGVVGVGEGVTPALAALAAGFNANTGQDSAGVMFGRRYCDAAGSVLSAVEAGINACLQTGYGVQVSAANYARAEAMSDISGRAQALPSPPCPVPVSAPPGPSATGGSVAAPLLWAVVELLVGDLWPSGSPAGMRAAAGAWRSFGTVLAGVDGELAGPTAVVAAQQIPEGEQIIGVLRGIGADLAGLAAQCAVVAGQLEGFASEVEATQNAIRDLLRRVGSIGGIVGEFFEFLRGHGEAELEQIAADIRTVLAHLKNEASAKRAVLGEVEAAVDSWVLRLEEAANRQFREFFGEHVGAVVSGAFNTSLDSAEGGFRWLVSNYEGLEDLNPARWAFDPEGAAATWKGIDQFARVAVDPGYLARLWQSDPESAKAMVKGLVRADEWDSQRPMLGLTQNALDMATLPFAAGDAAKAGEVGSAAARVVRGAEGVAEGGVLPGAVGKIGETGAAGSALNQVSKRSAEIIQDLEATPASAGGQKQPVAGKPVGLERPSGGTPGAVVEKQQVPAGAAAPREAVHAAVAESPSKAVPEHAAPQPGSAVAPHSAVDTPPEHHVPESFDVGDSGPPPSSASPVEGFDYGFGPERAFEILSNPADEIARLRDAGVPPHIMEGYDPLAGLTVEEFRDAFTVVRDDGRLEWDWAGQAPNDGFDGPPTVTDRIPEGYALDRFGSEYGAFMAEDGAPLSARAMPPGVATSYNQYIGTGLPIPEDLPWEVRLGPSKEAFAQSGGAKQWVVFDVSDPESPTAVAVRELRKWGIVRRR